MNIAKNMEAIFVAAVALTCVTAFASNVVPAVRGPGAEVALSTGKMATVVITGKRPSAAEKAKLAS